MGEKKKKLVIVDGMAYAFRAFYAVGDMSNSKGFPTGSLFGFVHALRRAERTFKPDYAVVAFDSPGGSFRDEMLADYKGHRDAPPEDLVKQFPAIEELVPLAGWHLVKKARFEADDIMATLAAAALRKGVEVVLMTSDKDMLQLASDQVKVYRENPKGATLYGPKEVRERYGIGPECITDLLGLMGDSSDNIPGVPGIGEKTASKLLMEYGSLEAVLKAAGKITQPKLSENLKVHAATARLSKKVAELEDKVPLGLKLEDLEKGEPVPEFLAKLKEYEFKSLAAEFAAKMPEPLEPAPHVEPVSSRKKRGSSLKVEESPSLDEPALKRAGIKAGDSVGLAMHGPGLAAIAQGSGALVFRPKSYADLHGLLGKFKRVVVFESKPLQVAWVKAGLPTLDNMFDLQIGLYLAESSKTVRNLSEARSALDLEDLKLKEGGDELFEPPAEEMGRAARAAWEAGEALTSKLRKDGLTPLYEELEGPLIPVSTLR